MCSASNSFSSKRMVAEASDSVRGAARLADGRPARQAVQVVSARVSWQDAEQLTKNVPLGCTNSIPADDFWTPGESGKPRVATPLPACTRKESADQATISRQSTTQQVCRMARLDVWSA